MDHEDQLSNALRSLWAKVSAVTLRKDAPADIPLAAMLALTLLVLLARLADLSVGRLARARLMRLPRIVYANMTRLAVLVIKTSTLSVPTAMATLLVLGA